MYASVATLAALAGLVAASPCTPPPPPSGGNAPQLTQSKGFNLVVKVTDPSKDLKPSIHNTYITGVHVGAGIDAVTQSGDHQYASLFYANGTQEQVTRSESSIIADSGADFFQGFLLSPTPDNKDVRGASLYIGQSTPGVGISAKGVLSPSNFFACKQRVTFGDAITFSQVADASKIPKGCAPVSLVAECAELPKVSPDAKVNHKYALDTKCYKDAKSVKLA